LKSGKHDGSFYREMWKTLLDGKVWRGRFTNRRKDGTLYEETATISPIRDESGRIANYVAVKRDVTGETMLQQQLLHAQKMEAVGTLAGGMAHDFNNILQAILGYSDLLLMKKGPADPDRKKLEVILQAARDGAHLVSRILTFSRKADTNRRPIDLNEEIRKAQTLLRRTIPRMIDIKLVLDDNLRIIDADPGQLEQILLNLAVNAHHAMPEGGQLLIETSNVSLSGEYLQTHLGAKPGHYVLLTVSDTGLGIQPEVLDRIFEPFFTTKKNGEGTGLGLSMVHGIVMQHGGYIRCYSESGRGTSFKIYLPVYDRELGPDLELTREMPVFGTETILLVDDDDRIREVGRQMIEMGGYQVITARTGEEALETYSSRREEISVVILDLIMPGMGGKRCLEALLGIDPNVRVLVASGYSENGLTAGEKDKAARGFVNKPYDAKGILVAIRKVLDKGHL
jgi:two-component system cell cycle sensor histidine kinase/response regulator CckA